ncbi:MAG: hypothetical protein ACR2OH_08240 [Microthrixaceae bacterium]
MNASVLTPAKVSHRLATSTGLWRAMAERVVPAETLPTIEVAEIAPRMSMFDYDPAEAVALTEIPDCL